MRLLCIHRYSHRKGGAEAAFLDHIDLFETRGWNCAQFVMAHPQNPTSQWERYFPSYFDLADSSQRTLNGVTRFFYSHEAKRSLDRMLCEFQPDIVHLHGAYHQLTVSILEPIMQKAIPLVFTAHDLKLMCPAYYFYSPSLGVCERCASGNTISCAVNRCIHNSYAASLLYAAEGALQRISKKYIHAVNGFVMPSRFILNKFRQHGFPPDKLHYIPNFFESSSDVAVSPHDVAETRAELGSYVLFFGRLSAEKGIKNLISACQKVSLPLVIAGDGPEKDELRKCAQQSNVKTTFLGHLQGNRLWTVVQAARCVVLPSVWYENAPKSILEAQARGQIVVASDIGGISEMIDDGVTGYLFEMGNIVQLAEKLHTAFNSSDATRSHVGRAAQLHALATFTKDRYFREMVELYENLLVQKKPQASVSKSHLNG